MSAAKSFNPAKDIPSLAGKVILITGANSGLGKHSALELAKHGPAQLWLAARSLEKGTAAAADIQKQSPDVSVSPLQLDLASFDSIKAAAKQFLAATTRLDILFLNAGIMGAPPSLTQDGYEVHMGTNHVGHALLLKLLTPRLIDTAAAGNDVRVLSIASVGYKFNKPEGIRFTELKNARTDDEGLTVVQRYMQSKLANLLYAREFARRHPQFKTVSVDPGPVATALFTREAGDEQMRHLQEKVAPVKTGPVEEGVKNHLWAATAAEVLSGTYYEPIGLDAAEGMGKDERMAAKLWEWTEKELDGHDI
ncbi:NAD(P)-binding protein [Thozetella sp. PMI_491]|nr:NAD(P)-binding protein [Thozetella sp. PMI_491]